MEKLSITALCFWQFFIENKKEYQELKQFISEGYTEVSDTIGQLKMIAEDGKMRLTDCANTETLLRIIQSIEESK